MDENQIFNLNFPFKGFKDHTERVKQWQEAAFEIVKKINQQNIGFVAQTGSGKTIVAFYCIKAIKKRCLFLAPTKVLCRQHLEFYQQITGENDACLITGETSLKERLWKDDKKQIVFATPHVFLADKKKSLVDFSDFDLVIIDECHKASKKYPYVEIAQNFKVLNKSIITMSASPGKNQQAIAVISKNLSVENWQKSAISTPEKKNSPIFIDLDPIISHVKELVSQLKLKNIREIKQFAANFSLLSKAKIEAISDYIPRDDLKTIESKSENLSGKPFYYGKMILAKYNKIYHLENLILTESYYNFLQYTEKLKQQNSKSGNNILESTELRQVVSILKQQKPVHPKVLKLLEVLKKEKAKNHQGLLFFSNKEVARYLEKLLISYGYKAACLFGGQGKSTKAQNQVINDIKDKKLDFVLATSVVEEGLSVPNFDFVLNYSLPNTPVSQLQRAGRTGRFNQGVVYYLIMKIDFEEIKFFSNFSSLKKMDEMIYQKPKKHYDPDQLSLF